MEKGKKNHITVLLFTALLLLFCMAPVYGISEYDGSVVGQFFNPVNGDTHNGEEIIMNITVKGGTPPYTIEYSFWEEKLEGYDESGEADVTYNNEKKGTVVCDGEEVLTYRPSDPSSDVGFAMITVDSVGESSREESMMIYAAYGRYGGAMYRITERVFSDYSDYTESYSFTNVFPEDIGFDPDYSVYVYSQPRKSIAIGPVGTEPRIICSFELKDINVLISCEVPFLPDAIRRFANRNGLSALKLSYVRMDDYKKSYQFDDAYKAVYFYPDYCQIGLYYQPNWAELYGKPTYRYPSWSVGLAIRQSDALLSGQKDKEMEMMFLDKRLDCIVWQYDPERTWFPAREFQEIHTTYGGPGKETIEYYNDSLWMEDEEAKWFIEYLEQQLRE